jgi:beta-1,4-mannooligosaccharide/beta-1,4-mannosyl-N-acetylglucosamine phosphorylase
VIARSRDYILSPQVLYEQVGDTPNVVFPCAALVDGPTDRLTIYYGGADTVVCLAHGYLSQVMDFVKTRS